ncbi:MAG: dihydropyrimidinase [Ruminococcus sp.]|nr:dihydropyrimidinase [Ruminococcus sp.]
MSKILLKGGSIVSPRGVKRADILINGEKIVAVGRNLSAEAQTVDVGGKLIFPGFIDAHTHFDLEVSDTVTADDFDSGTKSAIAGGVTTVVDFATQNKGETLSDALNNWHIKAFGKSSCDYAFHMAISDWREDIKNELPAMFEQGVTSFKVYMIYDAMELNDRAIYELMKELKKYGGIVGCHCENSGIIGKLREEALARGETQPKHHPLTRPDFTEAEAVNRFLAIAKAADAPCIVVHLSTRLGYQEVLHARDEGVEVYAETCPQYLLLDDSVYDAPFDTASEYVCSPPLRKREDNKALWDALKTNNADTVSTDHCSFTVEQKRAGESDFTKIPNGMPGVETRAILLYTYGVKKHRISLQQMCAYLSENPARLYGMYPKKGVIKAGSDADLVIFEPRGHGKITADRCHSRCGYTPFEGVKTVGGVEQVYLRGKLVYRGGEIVLEHSGKYVTRDHFDL